MNNFKYLNVIVRYAMTEQTMADVSHEAPHGDGANQVWERGTESSEDREVE